MMENEANTGVTVEHTRRSTDRKSIAGVISSPSNSLRSKLFGGFFSLGLVSALLTVGITFGKHSNTLDSVVKNDTKQDERMEKALITMAEMVVVLRDQGVQQKESDVRFEKKFDDVINKLEDVDDSVNDNEKNIIILQQKISMLDNTRVIRVAMR